jgi:23S rRNA (uracil1939-C5)-methyltransferase
MTAIVDVSIDSIAAGGDGVGRVEGMVTFVPRSAPGDRLRVRWLPGKGFARAEIDSVADASPLRVDPTCVHYTIDRCGGCQLQHMEYGAQLGAKAGIIRDGIVRIGRRAIELPSVRPSPAQWRYRTKLTLALRRVNESWFAGLHPYDAPGDVFALKDCPITDERVLAVFKLIMGASKLLPPARELRVAVRMTDAGRGEPMFAAVVEGGSSWGAGAEFFAAVPVLSTLWWQSEKGPRIRVASRTSMLGAASFGQVNEAVAAELRAELLRRVGLRSPATVVDAYAGVGDTAEPLARAGARVTAIEWDRDAAARCGERLQAPSSVMTGKVEDHLSRALPADVVIVNPPRTGLDARVTTILEAAAATTRALFYVSCNPATLGRDLARLPSYRVVSVQGFDMFPQTAHVETVCELEPAAAAGGAA